MIKRSIVLVLCTIGLLTGDAKAQIFLENGKVSLAVSGGQHLNGSMVIHNTTSQPEQVKVYWEDFEYVSPYDGTKKFLPAGTSPMSASQWVTFSPQSFIIPAMGQENVEYTVAAPDQVDEGHYGIIFFEKTTDASMAQGDEVKLITRVGCLFFIDPANKNKKADLEDTTIKADTVTASFVNQGNVVLIPRTTYYIMKADGTVLNRGEAKKLYVPPGATGPLEITLKRKLDPGQYTLMVNSDLEDGDVVVKEIGLNVDSSSQMTIVSTKD